MRWGWIIFWIVVAIIIFHHPAEAAHTVSGWFTAISTFVTNL
jgi:hypothetical protein